MGEMRLLIFSNGKEKRARVLPPKSKDLSHGYDDSIASMIPDSNAIDRPEPCPLFLQPASDPAPEALASRRVLF
jgi:hypothetical protein